MRWDRQNLFVIVGFVIAEFIFTCFSVILPAGLSNGVRYNGVFVIAGFLKRRATVNITIATCNIILDLFSKTRQLR